MGEPGWLAGLPASFAPGMRAASIQFCLRQGGGWWGGGAASMAAAWMVSNYTFPSRKKSFFSRRGTLNDSSWKNLLDVIYTRNAFSLANLCAQTRTHVPSSASPCLAGTGGGPQKAWGSTELLQTSARPLACSLSLGLHRTGGAKTEMRPPRAYVSSVLFDTWQVFEELFLTYIVSHFY